MLNIDNWVSLKNGTMEKVLARDIDVEYLLRYRVNRKGGRAFTPITLLWRERTNREAYPLYETDLNCGCHLILDFIKNVTLLNGGVLYDECEGEVVCISYVLNNILSDGVYGPSLTHEVYSHIPINKRRTICYLTENEILKLLYKFFYRCLKKKFGKAELHQYDTKTVVKDIDTLLIKHVEAEWA